MLGIQSIDNNIMNIHVSKRKLKKKSYRYNSSLQCILPGCISTFLSPEVTTGENLLVPCIILILLLCNFVCFSQFSSVAQLCPTHCDTMNRSTPGLPVHHQLPEFTQTHFHWVSDAIQPSHPLSSPSPPAPYPSQHQSLFQWVNSLHEVAKGLEFQL